MRLVLKWCSFGHISVKPIQFNSILGVPSSFVHWKMCFQKHTYCMFGKVDKKEMKLLNQNKK